MKNLITFIFVITLSTTYYVKAQNQLGKSDDLARISLTAIVPDQLKNIPAEARQMLTNKLANIAAKNGLSGSATNPRFIITANIDVEDKGATPSAPPQIWLKINVTFYIADAVTQTIFASTNISAKGVGKDENRAYTEAINAGVTPTNTKIRAMIEQGKEKIVEYYNSQCDFILKDAQAKVDQKDFGHALYILSSVPQVSKECYDKAMDMVPIVYQQYIDWKCTDDLAKGKAFWAKKDFNNALKHLAEIEFDSKCNDEAQKLIDEIDKNLTDAQRQEARQWQLEDRAMALVEKMQADDTAIKLHRISASERVATTAISNNKSYYNYSLGWLFGY